MRYCTRSASTAMQYWIEQKSAKANYMKKSVLFQLLKKKENALVLSLGTLVGPEIGWTGRNVKV
jgi:hypothetical protein